MASMLKRPSLPTAINWLKANLFNGWLNTALTLACLYLVVIGLVKFLGWGVLGAVWSGTPQDCAAAAGSGACWAAVGEKHRFILFGRYNFEEQWRPAIGLGLVVAMVLISFVRRFWTRWLALAWAGTIAIFGVLMWGGVFGLTFVSHENWGGLPLTLILAGIGMLAAFPLGIVLALGRRSKLPVIRSVSVAYIELIRGVPLITVLFMASVMIPLFLPNGVTFDKLLRAQIGFILFAAAYLAEVVRGGLQAVAKGQSEAADALGLGYWQRTWLIVLPQALRLVIPPLVNTFIGMFKDTSLVIIISLVDLLNAGKIAIGDPLWRSYYVEMYVFMALIYFWFCYSMSKFSQNVEKDLNKGMQR